MGASIAIDAPFAGITPQVRRVSAGSHCRVRRYLSRLSRQHPWVFKLLAGCYRGRGGRVLALLCEVAVAGVHEYCLVADEVGHLDGSLVHGDLGAVAEVGGVPDGADVDPAAVASAGAVGPAPARAQGGQAVPRGLRERA